MQLSSEHDIQDCKIAVFVVHPSKGLCMLLKAEQRGDVVYINDVGWPDQGRLSYEARAGGKKAARVAWPCLAQTDESNPAND